MAATRRLAKELSDITKDPSPGCSAAPKDGDMYHWEGSVAGPVGTPYDGGIFKVDIVIPQQYPHKAPEVKFVTKVYHPNIDVDGKACIEILKNWAPSITLNKILAELAALLANPNGATAVQAEIGVQFMNERPKFDETARQWTRQYAS